MSVGVSEPGKVRLPLRSAPIALVLHGKTAETLGKTAKTLGKVDESNRGSEQK